MLPLRHQQIYLVKCVMTRWRACYRSSCYSIETALRGRNREYCHFKIRSKLDGRFYNEWERAEARSASPAVWYIRFCQYRKVGFERSARCGEDGSSFLFLFNFQTSAQSAIEKTRPWRCLGFEEDLILLRKSAEAHNQVRFTTSGVFEDCQTQSTIRSTKTKSMISFTNLSLKLKCSKDIVILISLKEISVNFDQHNISYGTAILVQSTPGTQIWFMTCKFSILHSYLLWHTRTLEGLMLMSSFPTPNPHVLLWAYCTDGSPNTKISTPCANCMFVLPLQADTKSTIVSIVNQNNLSILNSVRKWSCRYGSESSGQKMWLTTTYWTAVKLFNPSIHLSTSFTRVSCSCFASSIPCRRFMMSNEASVKVTRRLTLLI
jgi:hypothetical protein